MIRKSDRVRYSRAGDQFHYRWAARRCLGLLDPKSQLVCITIEGASRDESQDKYTETGEEVIDVAEYYGDSAINRVTKICYHQLKHSYKNDSHWTLSALKTTLTGFFKRFESFRQQSEDASQQTIEFTFTTNRRVAIDVHELISRVQAKKLRPEDESQWDQIKRYLGTCDDTLAQEFFCKFRINDANDIHWKQRNILIQELKGYLPGSDKDAADQIWRLVVDKASPEQANNPEITREDVLRYLNTDEDELYPAPCLIESGEKHFLRDQEEEFSRRIIENKSHPIVIHADGGVGKSALARRLCNHMPDHSVAVLYDCFGNGEYRNVTKRRDEHRVGLVQIANELASLKLCDPLIPTRHATAAEYLKAFIFRLTQSIEVLKGSNPNAKLVLFIDAADNAELAAEEFQERASFARDLIRQQLPEGVVLVFLSRSHRVEKLDPPNECIELKLRAFSETETSNLLKMHFHDATSHDINEFHRLSSQNPRVQATALNCNQTLSEILLKLGPYPINVEDAIKNIFEQSIAKLLDNVPNAEASQLNALCEALAALRPFIPIEVLSLTSGLSASAIRTFVHELGRPLTLTGDAVQFFDEPSETWFRETYKPNEEKLVKFIRAIESLASKNSYVASALPQLMLEAGQYSELIDLVLNDGGLPNASPVEKRNVSLQRFQFALKAALRKVQYDDAAKLALKSGGEVAGKDRVQSLIQANTYLISHLLPAQQLREMVSQNKFSTNWHGGHHAYSACLLSGCTETLDESRGYLRLAYKWVEYWSRLSKEERRYSMIDINEIVELAMSELYLHGADSFVRRLARWKPKHLAYQVSSIVFQHLVELGKYELIDEVVAHSLKKQNLPIAAIDAQSEVLKYPPSNVVVAALGRLEKFARQMPNFHWGTSYKCSLLSIVNSVVRAAIATSATHYGELVDILNSYIPSPENFFFDPHSSEPQFTILRANCLRAALQDQTVKLSDLVKEEVIQQMESSGHSGNSETEALLKYIDMVLPWHEFWVQALLRKVDLDELDPTIDKLITATQKLMSNYYQDERLLSGVISSLWIEILIMTEPTPERMNKFVEWKVSLNQNLFTPTLMKLVRLCASSVAYSDHAYTFAQEAYQIIDEGRMNAENKIDSFMDISRSIYSLSPDEANIYLEKAVEVAGRAGEENLNRWEAFLELAVRAAAPVHPQPELCYRLSRAAEVGVDLFGDDKYLGWDKTIEGITKLCPASSFSTLSRWKDRKFCSADEIMPRTIGQLIELDKISPTAALALIGYQYSWSIAEIIQLAMASVEDKQQRKMLFDQTLRYVQISGANSQDWKTLVRIAAENGWNNWNLSDYLAQSESNERLENKRIDGSLKDGESVLDLPKNWDQIFSTLQQYSSELIQVAHKKFLESDPPYYLQQFAEEYFRRIPSGQEKEALEAIFFVPDFNLYDIRGVYESIPQNWTSRNHIRKKLASITERVCKTHFHEIRKSAYYQDLPNETIEKISDVTTAQIDTWVLEAASEVPLNLSSSRLFSLVGLIAPKLTRQQATAVLSYGLDLLEEDMTEKDGDGSWSLSLQPPETVEASIAGYIWASLASPKTAERWQAAHVICQLCAFEEHEILAQLQRFALGCQQPNPFHASGLPIYELSAKLWLLFALQRAVRLGYTNSVLRFEEFIRTACSPTERHLMIRGIGARILLELERNETIELGKEELNRLQLINVSKLDVIESDTYLRKFKVVTPSTDNEDDKYYFGYDISDYWFKSLGRVFGFATAEIENRALRIIRDEFGVPGKGGWQIDSRHHRDLYGKTATRHSHGIYPKVEDLAFYHAYNSMMIVAGELIDTEQRHQGQGNDDYDELDEWIAKHSLTRSDSLWLADRRDPDPLEVPRWKFEEVSDIWNFSVNPSLTFF